MRVNNNRVLGIFGLSFAIFCFFFHVLIFDSLAAFSNPIEIQGKHVVENDETLIAGRHIFVLTAKDAAPMPAGSTSGVKKVTINSNESFSFGKIEYDEAGIYSYTVSREINKSENLIQDDSVYNCVVEVMNDGTAVVIFEKKGTEGKPNYIVYTDRMVDPAPAKNPDPEADPDSPSGKNSKVPGIFVKTGDESDLQVYIIALISVLVILGAMYSDRIRPHKNDK